MKDNQQIGQAIYKMSEGKRKQLFNHLLNEFRNSKVNLGSNQAALSGNNMSLGNVGGGTPNYNMSGQGPASLGLSMGMYNPQSNLSGSTPSTIKHSKKKSSSIDKNKQQMGNSTIIHASNAAVHMQGHTNGMGTDMMKKTTLPKKSVNHKKSKSYITGQNIYQVHNNNDNSVGHNTTTSANQSQLYNQQLYYQQMLRKGDISGNNGSTLENSFGHATAALNSSNLGGNNSVLMNKSYERILAETIEAQNMSAGGAVPQNYIANQYYQLGNVNQKISGKNNVHQQNMTLQLSSKRGPGSNNVSQSRIIQDQYDSHIKREKSTAGHQSTKSNHSQKSLTSSKYSTFHQKFLDSKYDQQLRKKSRGSDQFQMQQSHQQHHNPSYHQMQRSKCESNRNSKKNSPNNTINASKGTINIREARTKPTSPDRSQYALIGSYKGGQTTKAQGHGTNSFIVPGSMVNQREERKALNMISNIGSAQQQHQQQHQMVNHHQPRINNQDFVSIQQQATSKRKNFKNMFYSPKGGRDAYTEPHSKFPSQAHTKEHSPAHRILDMTQQLSQTAIQPQILPSTINHSTTLGHHPKIRASANKPPTQLKNKSSNLSGSGTALMYSTKDSNKRSKLLAQSQIQELEGAFQTNSFLEESYLKNATNNISQLKRDDISFDSSQNQFSQTGTPNHYKVKLTMPPGSQGQQTQVIKKINIVGRETLNSQLQQNQHLPQSMLQSNSTIERKPKKIIVQNGNAIHQQMQHQQQFHAHTTGLNTKNNSQAPSPTHSKLQKLNQQQNTNNVKNRPQNQHKKQRFMSEASSPQNIKLMGSQQQQQIMQQNHHNGLQLQEIPPHKKRGISIGGNPSSGNNFQIPNHQDSIDSLNQSKKFTSGANSKLLPNQNQQQFLFNQYVKSKKPRHQLESNEASLERQFQPSNTLNGSNLNNPLLQPLLQQSSQEPFFDQQHLKHSATEISPRSKEVNLIKSLIKECFQKYSKPPKTQIELYKIGKMLGKGAFGRVNLGLHRLTRRLVAIKTINMEFMKDESSKKKMSNEISILKMLRHPNVVKLLETFDTDKHHLIVMELCPGGDLLNYVRKRRKLNENMAKFVFKQIMEGIAYLHKNGVVHRDIKLDNILLDGHGHIKLADFGVSRKVSENNELLFEQCGTPAYIAPEIVRELGYKGYPVDIWSAGVCLYAMLYGNVPFKANQMGDLNKMILDANIEYKDTASEEARDLMMRMLQKNPNKRLTAEEVLDHQWFDEVDEQINIFDEQELDLIKKEFTYVCQKAKLKELKARQPDDLNTEFTEHSINSNENTLMKNNSSRSVILCPFNTQAGAAAKSIYEDIIDMLVDKDMAIRFNARVRECDRQYEKFNNQDFDNGVYHKYAYNQGKNQNGQEVDPLKEEVIDKDDVHNKNLVRMGKNANRMKQDIDAQNYYIQIDDKIVNQVEDYGFPKQYIIKCLGDNINNHCTTSYYLLCMDQNY